MSSKRRDDKRSRLAVHKTLQFRITLLFIFLMLAIGTTTIMVVQTIGKSLIIKENQKYIQQKGNTIVAKLGQRLSYAEAMVKTLGNMAETLPLDADLFKKTIPRILYGKEADQRIAGGGIWPEPFAFHPEKRRNSFFWGRDASNIPVYFDDYNDPDGPGYHQEEWYVPARYIRPDAVYWSKSYTDPYSNEPMVTCTAPFYRSSQFRGVSTVDLKLADLSAFLDREATAISGYIFAVDRNNRMLSFPGDGHLSGGKTTPLISAETLAKNQPRFKQIARALETLNQTRLLHELPDRNAARELAERMSSQSYQITVNEAMLIVATFPHRFRETARSEKLRPIPVQNDLILGGPAMASIFLMPRTHWKIVIVYSLDQVTGVADSISMQIFFYLSFGILACVLIAYLYLRSVLILPLKNMTRQLIKTVQNRDNDDITLPETMRNELGDLAFWFNRRNEELRRSNAKLNESEKRYRTIFESSRDAIFIQDMNNRFIDCNQAAVELFGFASKRELLSVSPSRVSPRRQPDGKMSSEKYKTNLEIVLETGSLFFEWTHQRMNKDRFDANVLATKMTLDKKTVIQSTIRDITDQKRTQEMVIQAEKMLSVGGLAAGMAHEINNPLAGMMQNALVVKNRLENRELSKNIRAAETAGTQMDAIYAYMETRGISNLLENIVTSGKRAARIVSNMLSFSKKGEKSFSSHRMDVLLDETLALIRTDYNLKKQYDVKQVRFTKDYEPDVPMMRCDKSKVQQVLINVLKNSVEAMHDAGQKSHEMHISCRIHTTGEFVETEIEDNGPGMDDATSKRIFEPFFTTKGVDRGTGLGLSVSYFIIVDDHGGKMAVESTPGAGTKMIIKVPVIRMP